MRNFVGEAHRLPQQPGTVALQVKNKMKIARADGYRL
jgi:hypothetical protein